MKNKNDISKDLKAAMRANLRDELKAELEEVEAEVNTKSNIGKVFSIRHWWAAAACIALIIFAGLYLISDSKPDNSSLFASYFEPFDNVVFPINRSNENDNSLVLEREAYKEYEAGNYEKAIILFKNMKANLPLNLDNDFYLAISYLGMGDAPNAMPILEDLSDKNDFRFKKQAEWYLALTYLQIGESEKAKKVFYKIKNQKEHPFSGETDKVLKSLN